MCVCMDRVSVCEPSSEWLLEIIEGNDNDHFSPFWRHSTYEVSERRKWSHHHPGVLASHQIIMSCGIWFWRHHKGTSYYCMYVPFSLPARTGYGVWYSMGQHCTWWIFTAKLWSWLYRQVHTQAVECCIIFVYYLINASIVHLPATYVFPHNLPV